MYYFSFLKTFPGMINKTFTRSVYWRQRANVRSIQRLWAYRRINYLLNKKDCKNALDERTALVEDDDDYYYGFYESDNQYSTENDDQEECHKKAIEIAMEHNFVTKLTSMFVVADKDHASESSFPENSEDLISLKIVDVPITSSHNASDDKSNCDVDTNISYEDHKRKSNESVSNENLKIHSNQYCLSIPYFQDCALYLYPKTHYRGEPYVFNAEFDNDYANVPSLEEFEFDNKVASIYVEGQCCFKVFTNPNFGGDSMEFYRDRYALAPGFPSALDIKRVYKKASSIKICG